MNINPEYSHGTEQAFEYVKENGFLLPVNMIGSLHHFTGKDVSKKSVKKYLSAYYFVNPETDGFEPPKNAEYNTSDWAPLQIARDPNFLLRN